MPAVVALLTITFDDAIRLLHEEVAEWDLAARLLHFALWRRIHEVVSFGIGTSLMRPLAVEHEKF